MPDLLSLPPELLLSITSTLPPDALLALKLTHPALHATLPPGPPPKQHASLTRCARLAMRTYLAPPNPDPRTALTRCILCKAHYPAALFNSGNSPACVPVAFDAAVGRREVVPLPPRFCAWHVPRLARVVRTAGGGRNGWVSRVEGMCMHCGAVRAWRACGCECASCGVREVRTYTRYLDNKRECRTFLFWREEGAGGRLWVRETCWDQGRWKLDKSEVASYIDVPVQFEDGHGASAGGLSSLEVSTAES